MVNKLKYNALLLVAVLFYTSNVMGKPEILADAGKDQSITDGRLVTTLEAILPQGFTGKWTILEGEEGNIDSDVNPKSTFTGKDCQTYKLRWTITDSTQTLYDDVIIKFFDTPDEAKAGDDITVTDAAVKVKLMAVQPANGKTSWSKAEGENGLLSDTLNPITIFSGNPCTEYTLKWSVFTACKINDDFIKVKFSEKPSEAKIVSKNLTVECDDKTTISAMEIQKGRGYWKIEQGEQGQIENINTPVTKMKGLPGQSYQLSWTVQTNCESSVDYTNVYFSDFIDNAQAGDDQQIPSGTDIAQLQANTLPSTVGEWSVVKGEGGTFEDKLKAITTFKGIPGETYELTWTLKNKCKSTSDNITISFVKEAEAQ